MRLRNLIMSLVYQLCLPMSRLTLSATSFLSPKKSISTSATILSSINPHITTLFTCMTRKFLSRPLVYHLPYSAWPRTTRSRESSIIGRLNTAKLPMSSDSFFGGIQKRSPATP